MAGTYPQNPGFESVEFQINTPSQTVESFNGLQRRIGMNVQYYTFSARYNNVTRRDFMPVIAFLSRQSGPVDSFQIVLPEISYSRGINKANIGIPLVRAPGAKTGVKTLQITGCVPNTNEIMRAGDMIRFGNHTKCYMLVDPINSNSQGQAVVNFAGGLVKDVPAGTLMQHDAIPFTVVLDSAIQEYSVTYGGISNMQVGFREVW
jgi:hypothetical protein